MDRSTLTVPQGLLFDMDGTLTRPHLDFPKIKREMGIDPQRPILEALEEMDDSARAGAIEILQRHEDEAAELSELNRGCHELLHWINSIHRGVALVTRNSLKSTRTVLQRHKLQIDVIITRDDGVFKPSPEPLFLACEKLGISRNDAWMIGDGSHDIEAAEAAGMFSIWISHGAPAPPFAAAPHVICRDLLQLREFLKSCDFSTR